MNVARLSLAAVMITLFFVTCARAAEPPLFPRGTFTLDSTVGGGEGFGKHDLTSAFGDVGINYFLFDNFSLGAEIQGLGLFQAADEDAGAINFSLDLRHHLLQRDDNTLYLDVLFGPAEASDQVPAGGTRFNFITRAGIGVTHRLSERLHLMAGVRYWHLSNARIEGIERNPSVNGVEAYLGVMFAL